MRWTTWDWFIHPIHVRSSMSLPFLPFFLPPCIQSSIRFFADSELVLVGLPDHLHEVVVRQIRSNFTRNLNETDSIINNNNISVSIIVSCALVFLKTLHKLWKVMDFFPSWRYATAYSSSPFPSLLAPSSSVLLLPTFCKFCNVMHLFPSRSRSWNAFNRSLLLSRAT